ncbi:DUF6247 family protein [Actinoalloteichus hymeniacidonis]|uniref:Prevent-host-death family protein n=1 Tax=Actinoalloteichus hymeniacidonis TaxID=340345 RepID=A0AAC9HLZ2_9PSEU|nr:DUF6247 family protein [Actinoalloteichus hymeniacidonis]AOS61645.1 hypothetical protein TL08_04075 [Actinoalloteichus hymeniacidonis]MBB5910342.1 hypothetical protein [Actinoalloteichus hymeniacidonis]
MTADVHWSELQRDPKSVARLADEGDVRVHRRDGPALLLTREDRANSRIEGALDAARLVRSLTSQLVPSELARAAIKEFPWVDVLSEDARAEFVAELARAFRTSAELGHWTVLAQTVREWKATAAIYADPELAARLTKPVDGDLGPVSRPADGVAPASHSGQT